MGREQQIRSSESVVAPPAARDAGLEYIGIIHTPWTNKELCPRQGRWDGPLCNVEIFPPWADGLTGVEVFARLEILYWFHESRRDLILQSPRDDGTTRGTFALRSPIRPNPIATSIVTLERIEGRMLFVRGLDCLNGTPLLDLKPDRMLFAPPAPPTVGDTQIGATCA